jgi:hypothetical protein
VVKKGWEVALRRLEKDQLISVRQPFRRPLSSPPHPWSLQHIPQSNIQVQFGFKILETQVYEAAELLKGFYCLTGNAPYSM